MEYSYVSKKHIIEKKLKQVLDWYVSRLNPSDPEERLIAHLTLYALGCLWVGLSYGVIVAYVLLFSLYAIEFKTNFGAVKSLCSWYRAFFMKGKRT